MPGEPAASQSDKISARLLYTAPKTGTINAVRKNWKRKEPYDAELLYSECYLSSIFLSGLGGGDGSRDHPGRKVCQPRCGGRPVCFIYGTTGVLLAVSFGDLRTEPVYLFFACMMAATVMEWITAKLLERLHRRKWWDYSGKKFNLNGYVCLQYSLLWGALGTASVLWGNNVLLRLCAQIPVWLLRPAVWVSLTVAVLD